MTPATAGDRRLRGRSCVVTGATAGIGRAAALGLARLGARVVVVGRDAARGQETLAALRAVPAEAELVLGDFATRAGVDRVAEEILARCPELHVLVNNAGVFQISRSATPDGLETTFAVNHLAPFQLTARLLPRLRASAPARIVNVASDAHHWGPLDLADLQSERERRAMRVYGRSKTANILFTRELARRLAGSGVTVNAVHPGAVATRLGRGHGLLLDAVQRLVTLFMRSPERGADTVVHLASSPELARTSGAYFADRRERTPAPHARDEGVARRLWDASESLTGVRYLDALG